MRAKSTRTVETVIETLRTEGKRAIIPTTFVPLSPDKLLFGKEIDLLFGLFHIMWQDMPKPRTYTARLADKVTREGNYMGCCLVCGFPGTRIFKC
ncbi:MAG: hypothetical protein ABSE82_13960 [Nitrososphaerales archaeon]